MDSYSAKPPTSKRIVINGPFFQPSNRDQNYLRVKSGSMTIINSESILRFRIYSFLSSFSISLAASSYLRYAALATKPLYADFATKYYYICSSLLFLIPVPAVYFFSSTVFVPSPPRKLSLILSPFTLTLYALIYYTNRLANQLGTVTVNLSDISPSSRAYLTLFLLLFPFILAVSTMITTGSTTIATGIVAANSHNTYKIRNLRHASILLPPIVGILYCILARVFEFSSAPDAVFFLTTHIIFSILNFTKHPAFYQDLYYPKRWNALSLVRNSLISIVSFLIISHFVLPTPPYSFLSPSGIPSSSSFFPYSHPSFPSVRLLNSTKSLTGNIVVGELLTPSIAAAGLSAQQKRDFGRSNPWAHRDNKYSLPMRYLRADHSLLGGVWLPNYPSLKGSVSFYGVFYLQEAAHYLSPPPYDEFITNFSSNNARPNVLIMGLGIGTAAQGYSSASYDVSVLEIDPSVYENAVKYFGLSPEFEHFIMDAADWLNSYTLPRSVPVEPPIWKRPFVTSTGEEDYYDDESSTTSKMVFTNKNDKDAYEATTPASADIIPTIPVPIIPNKNVKYRRNKRYNVVVHDLFSGGNGPANLFSQRAFEIIRDYVLEPKVGVLVVNIYGSARGSATLKVLRTLQLVYGDTCDMFHDRPANRRDYDSPGQEPLIINQWMPLNFVIMCRLPGYNFRHESISGRGPESGYGLGENPYIQSKKKQENNDIYFKSRPVIDIEERNLEMEEFRKLKKTGSDIAFNSIQLLATTRRFNEIKNMYLNTLDRRRVPKLVYSDISENGINISPIPLSGFEKSTREESEPQDGRLGDEAHWNIMQETLPQEAWNLY